RRLGGHAADDDRAARRRAVDPGRAARGRRRRRRHVMAALSHDHAAPVAPGDHRHHDARLHLELQLFRPRVRPNARRAGSFDRATDALRVQRSLQIRRVRLCLGAGRRDGARDRLLAVLLPLGAPEGDDAVIVSSHPKAAKTGQYVLMAVYMLFLAFPLLWLLSMSFKGARELYELHPSLIPHHPTLDSYRE